MYMERKRVQGSLGYLLRNGIEMQIVRAKKKTQAEDEPNGRTKAKMEEPKKLFYL